MILIILIDNDNNNVKNKKDENRFTSLRIDSFGRLLTKRQP